MKQEKEKRVRVSQEDIPAYSLKEALRISTAIYENGGKAPMPPLRVASAMNLSPNSGQFRMMCGASIAYGLTTGGYNASTIALEALALRILHPTDDVTQAKAKREAFLKPKIIKNFVDKYKGSPLPKDQFGMNVLEDMGVPRERTALVYQNILKGLTEVGMIHEIKGKKYLDADSSLAIESHVPTNSETELNSLEQDSEAQTFSPVVANPPISVPITAVSSRAKKVFITHGKNKAFVEPIKKLLQFGELEAIVSVERQSVSQPVTDKVMNDMRECGAAIIHVEDEMKLIDSDAKECVVLNPNVLIEIGAALALYGRRFILLVKDGVKLPSNLQGLYEVRYTGESLDGTVTIKLLEAINELKKLPLISMGISPSDTRN